MGRAKVVAPPPQDYTPEPLVAPPEEIVVEEIIEETFEVKIIEPSLEELEKHRIAQKTYEELQRQKAEEEYRLSLEIQELREQNQKLAREKEAAEKVNEEMIVAARKKATEQRSNQHTIQLNMEKKPPTLLSRIKHFFRDRRIDAFSELTKRYLVD